MQGMYAERMKIIEELEKETEIMRASGCQMAHNERDYRKAVRVETLNERMEGTPATLTGDLVRGIDYVAELRDALKCSEAMYKSSQEKINVLKLKLRVIEADIDRAWNSG